MGLFDSIVDGVSSVGRKIGGAVNSIGRKVAHTASKVGAKVGQAVKKVATAVIGKKATEKIEKVAGDVVEGVGDVVKATPAILAELPKAGSKIVKRLQQGKGIGFGDVTPKVIRLLYHIEEQTQVIVKIWTQIKILC